MLAIVTEGDTEVRKVADDVIEIPAAPDLLDADPRDRAAAVAGLSHRGAARMRRGSAAQSRQERHGRVTQAQRRTARFHPRQGFLRHHADIRKWVGAQPISERPADGLHPAHVCVVDHSGECRSRRAPRSQRVLRTPRPGKHALVPPHHRRQRRHAVAYPRGPHLHQLSIPVRDGATRPRHMAGNLCFRASIGPAASPRPAAHRWRVKWNNDSHRASLGIMRKVLVPP